MQRLLSQEIVLKRDGSSDYSADENGSYDSSYDSSYDTESSDGYDEYGNYTGDDTSY